MPRLNEDQDIKSPSMDQKKSVSYVKRSDWLYGGKGEQVLKDAMRWAQ